MKKFFIILILLLILIAGWIAYSAYLFFYAPPQPTPTTPHTVEVTTTTTPPKSITIGIQSYAYDYLFVSDPSTVTLISNYKEKVDVTSLMAQNHCTSAINGGFYDKSDKPLGFVQAAGKVVGTKIDSALVNGFVWEEASGATVISTTLPNDSFAFALQTGPLLLLHGNSQLLAIHSDAGARRMVAAKSDSGSLIFLTLYNAGSVYDGPLLGDLPDIMQAISSKEGLRLAEAINLDGGSASAFYSGKTSLSELTPVGSLFCVK